ncbi:MAG TPA: hypothetical protein VN883_14095 [Myxococcales bacterium]|nr:hypothetical protein [Myxococcales bacterium]
MPTSHRLATVLLAAAAVLPRAAPAAAAGDLPRTMVLLAEQNIGMAAPAASWMGKGEGALVYADLRVAESVVLDELRKAGFRQLVDPEIAAAKAASTISGATTQITAAQARKLGSLTGAEVIIVGQALVQSRGDLPELGPGWRTCAATLRARAVSTGSGDILATSEATQSAAHLDDLTCGQEAIKKASKAFVADMVKKIGARWSGDVPAGNPVHLRVKNVDSLRQAGEFRGALAQFIRGVKGVSQRKFEGGTQELDVQVLGSTEQFAEELEAKKLGNFSVKVKAVTAHTVDIELGRNQQRDAAPKR